MNLTLRESQQQPCTDHSEDTYQGYILLSKTAITTAHVCGYQMKFIDN